MNTNSYLIKRAFWIYFMTAALSILSSTTDVAISNIIAGNLLSMDHLAALGLLGPLITLLTALSYILSSGSVTLCNVYIGRNHQERVNPIFTLTLVAGVGLAAVLSLIFFAASKQVAVLLGAEGILISYVSGYIRYYALACLPFIMNLALMSFTRMDNSPQLSVYSVLAKSVANVVFILLFVQVLGMELEGFALAGALSNAIACLVLCTHFLKKTNTLRFVAFKKTKKDLKQIFTLGFPTALFKLSSLCGVFILNRLLLKVGGVSAVTLYTLYLTVDGIIGAIPLGIGQVVSFIESLFYGEEDRSSMRLSMQIIFKNGLIMCWSVTLLMLIVAPLLPPVFGITDPETAQAGTITMRHLAFIPPVAMTFSSFINFYQGTENVKMANILGILCTSVCVVASAYLLLPVLGIHSVWFAYTLGGIITIIVAVIIALVRSGKPRLSLDTLMLLPESFGKSIDSFEFSVPNTQDEVVNASQAAKDFCIRNGIDQRTAYHLALIIEEVCANVMHHGTVSNQKTYIDIRILHTAEGLKCRMRDGGIRFNPLERIGKLQAQEQNQSISLPLIQQLAAKVEYRYTLGMNNLVIEMGQGEGIKEKG